MLYNKYFKNNYEELITYYPKYYRDVFEMRAILETEGKLADDIEYNIERVFNNCFIDTADESTIRRLEMFLNIGVQASKTLEERRQFVKAHFIGMGKTSASTLVNMIRSYTGGDAVITFEPFDEEGNNCLFIDLPYSQGTLYADDIKTILTKMLPAHITYRIRLKMEISTGLYPVYSLFPMQNIYPQK